MDKCMKIGFLSSMKILKYLVGGVFMASLLCGCDSDSDDDAPVPKFSYTDAVRGCGNIFVYKFNEKTTEFISFRINAENFSLTTNETLLSLADYTEDLSITVDTYSSSVGEYIYCNDVVSAEAPEMSSWSATSGTIKVMLDTDNPEFFCGSAPFKATIVINDIQFMVKNIEHVIESLEFKNVEVGWCPG